MKDLDEPVNKHSPAMETIFKEVLAKYNSDTDELITLKELKLSRWRKQWNH